jgi:hypothetical protein
MKNNPLGSSSPGEFVKKSRSGRMDNFEPSPSQGDPERVI